MTAKTTQLEFENAFLKGALLEQRKIIEQQRREIERLKLERDDALFDPWRGRDVNTRTN